MNSTKGNKRLIAVKIIHTLIWAVMAAAVVHVFLSGLLGIINIWVYFSIFLILMEGAVLLIFRWSCPLTLVARKFTDDKRDNFDIYLPELVARHNKAFFTSMFFIGLAMVVFRMLSF